MAKKIGEKYTLVESLMESNASFEKHKNILNEREKAKFEFVRSLLKKIKEGIITIR